MSIKVFMNRTPRDVCMYLKDVGNRFNGFAARPTFVELYAEIPDIEKGWRSEARKKEISAREGCKATGRTYEAAYKDSRVASKESCLSTSIMCESNLAHSFP